MLEDRTEKGREISDSQREVRRVSDSRRSHNVELSFNESEDTDEQFDSVSEGSVQESPQTIANPERYLLRRESKQGSERDDGEEREDEDEGVRLTRELESPGDGDEDELG